MSNKLFRKGLVAAALTGLVTSVITGAPALAAVGQQLTIAPAVGTATATLVDQNFELVTSFNSGYVPASYQQLKYQITTDGVATIQAGVASVPAATLLPVATTNTDVTVNSSNVGVISGYSDGTGSVTTYTCPSGTHLTGNSAKCNPGNIAATPVTGGTTTTSAVTRNVLSLNVKSATATTATTSVNVVAFVDADNSGTLDSGEWQTPVTVTFKKYSEVSATPVITAPFQGDATIKSAVTFVGLNNESIDETLVGAVTKINGATTGSTTAALSSDGSKFNLTTTASFTGGDLVYVKATVGSVEVGTAATSVVGTRVVDSITPSLVASGDANAVSNTVRTNSAFTVKALIKDADDKALAGVAVTARVITGATLATLTSADTEKQLTVAGTTYSANAKLPGALGVDPVALTTDANGYVTLTLKSNNFVDGDNVTVYFNSQNLGEVSKVVTSDDASYTVFADAGTDSGEALFSTVDGTATNVAVKVYDQYGTALPDGYVAYTGAVSGHQATTADTTSGAHANVVGGAATLSITDAGTGAGYNDYTIYVAKVLSNGSYGTSAAALDIHIDIFATALPVAKTVTVTQGTPTDGIYVVGGTKGLYLNDYASVDSRYNTSALPVDVNAVYLSGSVKTAVTASTIATPIAGAPVTISAKGVQFWTYINGYDVTAVDSITTYADAAGNYEVWVYSNLAGKQTITFTSGSATSTATVVFAAAAAGTGKNLTISAPASLQPGQTATVSVLLTDKYGNPVAVTSAPSAPSVSFSAAGVGSFTAADVATDADGMAYIQIVTGPADAGTIKLTAKYDVTGDFTDTDAISATQNVVVVDGAIVPAGSVLTGSAPAASQSGRAVDVSFTLKTAAGAAVAGAVVHFSTVGGAYVASATGKTDANGVVAVKLIAGADVAGATVVTATAGAATATTTTTFGVTTAGININKKRVTVDWAFASGKKVVIVRDGKQIRVFSPTGDAADSFSFNLKKGTHNIKVLIAGAIADSETYKIKK